SASGSEQAAHEVGGSDADFVPGSSRNRGEIRSARHRSGRIAREPAIQAERRSGSDEFPSLPICPRVGSSRNAAADSNQERNMGAIGTAVAFGALNAILAYNPVIPLHPDR